MAYNLIITDRADELIDSRVFYVINKLKNTQAAGHLLDGISEVYDRLEENPYQFPDSKDDYLRRRGYKEALISDMQYKIVFRIEESTVYVVGLFHDLEDYPSKVIEQLCGCNLVAKTFRKNKITQNEWNSTTISRHDGTIQNQYKVSGLEME